MAALRAIFSQQCMRHLSLTKCCINKMYLCARSVSTFSSVLLKRRGHIEIIGEDSVKFLQGLLTNDVNLFHCDGQMSALYAMILNTKGRVLYDLILYKLESSSERPGFLLECDIKATDSIIKTFKPYKLRSKVEFYNVSDKFNSWAVMEGQGLEGLQKTKVHAEGIILTDDPRVKLLGSRLILPKAARLTAYFSNVLEISDQSVYDNHRVCLGVCEGMVDIEPGVALPLEYNIADLHGVSFQKGCYIGQELTARTYHTGVLRKRVMPIKLTPVNEQFDIAKGAAIKTKAGKTAGKVVSIYGAIGLGLMRLDPVKAADGLSVATSDGKDIDIIVDWPSWWN